MGFLSAADLAYMRDTQAEATPSAAVLFARTSGPDGQGGTIDGYPTVGTPVAGGVRLARPASNTSSGAVPADLADRYQESDLTKVHMALTPALKVGDRLQVEGHPRPFQVVSTDLLEAWTTNQTVWAVRT